MTGIDGSFSPRNVDGLKNQAYKIIEKYSYNSMNIPVTITIFQLQKTYRPIYSVSIAGISRTTELILERIREDLIKELNLETFRLEDASKIIQKKFKKTLNQLLIDYFPNISEENLNALSSYLVSRALGMGNIDILLNDEMLEEIAIDNADEPVSVYHRKYGWLKTNVYMSSEDLIRQYAARIGRRVGKQINVLFPLLDANLESGERINATLNPISVRGNTITLRKFSEDPWTITRFLRAKTMHPSAASLVWQVMQYEMSSLIVGGTAAGKTSTLNILSSFIQPNQRIISIEETKELRLPSHLYWIPMLTRSPNSEGKGEISMQDLLVNSLRMRPDRILVGEVRRKQEAETLFEAIHTGHSVYATFHANDAKEAITRLTNPPINVPKPVLPAISMFIVQFRNRRSGLRRTFQLAEVSDDANANVLYQYDSKKDLLTKKNASVSIAGLLETFTGFTQSEMNEDLKTKEKVLRYMVSQNIDNVDTVGKVIGKYYTDQEGLMRLINNNSPFIE